MNIDRLLKIKRCITCDNRISKKEDFATIKYKYGEKYLCEKCAEEFENEVPTTKDLNID